MKDKEINQKNFKDFNFLDIEVMTPKDYLEFFLYFNDLKENNFE